MSLKAHWSITTNATKNKDKRRKTKKIYKEMKEKREFLLVWFKSQTIVSLYNVGN